nr:receptor-type tyrosine-protein phosphatase zeta-like [Crassostrea gigas]
MCDHSVSMLLYFGYILWYIYIFIVCCCQFAVAQSYVNVALNKPAYQQFPYISKNGTDDKFHASNAVDGRKSDLSWDGGQCSFSNGNQTATWWVNLTSVHSIHHITIYFMTDNRTWGSSNTFTNHFLGFSVYVSNTTDRLQGTLCFKDNSFIADTIPAVFTTTCPVYGQYVIYFNDILLEGSNSRLAYSDLCEVEVYACMKTFYGINCTQKCDESCVNQMCHPETGKCISYRTQMVSLSIGITTVGVLLSIAFVVLMLYRRNSKHGEIAMTNSTLRYTSSNPMLNLSTFDNNKETDDHEDLSESINTPHSKLQNQPDMLRENKRLTCSDVDINGYIIMHENQLERKETTLENRLEKMIEEKSENEDDGFKKEYHTLLCGPRYPCEIGKRPENIKKNRFKSTVAYDHSRVILVAKCPDYINANYIDGVRQEKVYIATQGPRKNTVSDFWTMVWQERVEQVVMLTNLMEGAKAKCSQYWPELETDANFDIFTITTVDERHHAYYVIRKLNVTHTTINENRVVTQYHYTAWPDHDTPDPLCLLLFHNHVTRTKITRHKVPTLVHCSAGIGRTGTYIAIDALCEEGQHRSEINIAEYVRKMREKRMNMVQTYEQYKTIFLTLNEMFKAPAGVQTEIDYQKSLQLAKRDHHAFVSTVKKEFQKLLSIRHCYSENDYKMALTQASTSIRALDQYALFLTSSVPERENYINAIPLPSFIHSNAFIITHYQTTGNSVDFIRLITDYESDIVVCMEPLCNVEFAYEWLPTATQHRTVTPYTIQQYQERITEIKRREIEIVKEESSDGPWSIEIVEPTLTLTQDYSQTASQFLSLVSFVQSVKTHNPITVVSRDGAALCGVFCAVYNLIQQLTMDEEIDVFSGQTPTNTTS